MVMIIGIEVSKDKLDVYREKAARKGQLKILLATEAQRLKVFVYEKKTPSP